MIKDWFILGSVAFSIGFGFSLPLTRDVRQSLLAGATTVPAATAGVWAVTQRRKQSIATAFSSLQSEVQSLESQRQDLERSLQQAKRQAEQLESDLQAQQTEKQQLEQIAAGLTKQKCDLDEETQRLQKWLQELRDREATLNRSLSQSAIDLERNQTEKQSIQTQLSELEAQLSEQEETKQKIEREIANKSRDLKQAEVHYQTLQGQFQTLIAQRQEAEQGLTDLRDQQQILEASFQQLQSEVFALHQQRDTLAQEIETLGSSKQAEVQPEIKPTENEKTELNEATRLEVPQIFHFLELAQQPFDPPTTIEDFRLANPEHTHWLWEEVIKPRWLHAPFLGSVSLPKSQTDEIWGSEDIVDIVARNLRRQGENNLEYNRLLDRFSDSEQNWLKIYTFALSEYAYYAEENSGFWKGLCDRFNLTYRGDQQSPIPTLRDLAREGIDLLQLPKAVGGHSIVSTLWLQNGIPRHNLNHFAELVEILVNESSWQSLTNTEPSLLASELLRLCQQRFPGRTVLIRFLKASCSRGTEPITGHLLQSIANVALELQSQNLKPADVLLNAERREAFLTELPRSNFFLRDWEAFVEILSIEPKQTRTSETKREQKQLSLLLDVDDLLIQLTLPAQKLSNVEWGAGSCFIPEADWEGYITDAGEVEIEECIETVNSIGESWSWHLLDEKDHCLHEWQLDGIAPEFPCVMFDAWSGDRIFANPDITGSSEIIFFTARTNQIQASSDIELVESSIPCSIAGWHGQQLRLNARSTVIQFKFAEQWVDLRWNEIEQSPTLRGLKFKGSKPKFFSVPTLWYPPSLNTVNLSLEIQDLANSVCLTEPISISTNSAWSAIALDQWITQPGNYEVQLKSAESEWKERFQLDSEYHVCADDARFFEDLTIADHAGEPSTLPIVLHDSSEFWQATLKITGLWTLENLVVTVTDGENTIFRTVQANPSGCLNLEVSTFYDVLPPSNQYAIAFQRLGQAAQPLLTLEMNNVD